MIFTQEELAVLAKERIQKYLEKHQDTFGTTEDWEAELIQFANLAIGAQALAFWSLDDLPFEPTLLNKFKLFDMLESHTKHLGVEMEFNDTEFRDQAFTEIVQKIFHMTPEEYYESVTFKDFLETRNFIPVE